MNGVQGHLMLAHEQMSAVGSVEASVQAREGALEQLSSHVSDARLCCAAALRVLTSMNTVFKLEAGMMVPQRSDVHVEELLDGVLTVLRPQMQRGVALRKDFRPPSPSPSPSPPPCWSRATPASSPRS